MALKKPQRPFKRKVRKFFTSTFSLYVGAMLVVGSFTASVILINQYMQEVQQRAKFHEGIRRILKIVENSYPKHTNDDDITKLQKAENVSLSIAENKRNIEEIKEAIDDINHKLEHEWEMWKGSLYSFDSIARPRTWKECIEYCHSKKYETKLLCVESDAEQVFAATRVKHKPTDYFVGVAMQGRSWHCYDKMIPVKRHYWSRNKPTNKGEAKEDTPNCVIISRACGSAGYCWHDVYCRDQKRCICKRKPLAKWMS